MDAEGGKAPAESPEEGQPGAFAALLALQDEDVRADQLRYRRAHLPERQSLESCRGALVKLSSEAGELAARRDELAARRDALEGEAEQLGARARHIEERLASGGAASFRDQEAMAAEVASLAQRRGGVEDEELILMEEIEPLEEALAELGGRRAGLEVELATARQALDQAERAVNAELGEVARRRAPLVEALPPALLAEYTRLAGRLGGVAVARLVRGTCAGCHLSLSATELDRIRHAPPGGVFHCEQCGRILVPAESPATGGA